MQSVQPPLPPDEVHRLCAEFKSGIAVTKEEAARIEQDTVQQGDGPTGLWLSLRRSRLTASNFGAIASIEIYTSHQHSEKFAVQVNFFKCAIFTLGEGE